jgi:DOPA 4,5-dioxygenase
VTRSSDPKIIEGFHAHVYYTPETKPAAARLREAIGTTFAVTLGRWHDGPVGPHSQAMYQIAFAREALSVLVHPLTGDDYEDHATYSLWLGTPLPLHLDVLRAAHDP